MEVHFGDIVMNYQEKGQGFPLILIHGLSDDSNLWVPLMPEFSRYYRTITLDLRGHGQSSKPDMPYTIPLFSNDIFEFMNKMEISKANLIGLSLGSAIIQQFTLDHPERVRSIVLLSAFSHVDASLRDKFQRLRGRINSGGLDAFFEEAIKLVVTPDFLSANIEAIEELKKKAVLVNSDASVSRTIDACLEFDLKDKIKKIVAPTLILSGKEDIFTLLYLAKEIHHSIKDSKWVSFDGIGHNLILPENIHSLATTILNFLQT